MSTTRYGTRLSNLTRSGAQAAEDLAVGTLTATTTNIESTTVTIDDKNIELGATDSPSDSTADGGGIILKGASDKELLWSNAVNMWVSNQGIKVMDDSGDLTFEIDNNATNAANFKIENGAGNSRVDMIMNDGSADTKLTMKGQKVGINDTNPSHTLDVTGDVNLTGGLSFDSGTAVTSIDIDLSSVSGSDDTLASAKAIKAAIDAVPTGDITGITAGTGLSGGGTSGAVTLNVDAAQTQITSVGTIATGTWQGTDVGVAHGGTGVSTLTDGGVLLGSGTGAVTAMAVLTDGQMIVGDGTGDPVAESGATLRTSIGVGTGDSPVFTELELSGGALAFGNGQPAELDVNAVTGTNTAGRSLTISGGQSTGSGAGGDIVFKTANAGGSGSSANSLATALTISDDLSSTFASDVVVTGVLDVLGGSIAFGNSDDVDIDFDATAHDVTGKSLSILAGGPLAGTTNNIAGGSFTIAGGQGKGSGAGGDIIFKTANAAGSGSSLNALATALTISDDLSSTFAGAVTIGGAAATTVSAAQTLTNKTLTAPKVADNGFIADANGNELLEFNSDGEASIVNHFTVISAVADDFPVLACEDAGDTNCHLGLSPKGTGQVLIGSESATGVLSSVGAYDLKLQTNAGTNSGTMVITDGANGDITLTPNGTGKVEVTNTLVCEGLVTNYATKTSSYECTATDFLIIASGSGTTITLPENAEAGTIYKVKRVDGSNSITVSRKTSDTIDGATTYVLDANYMMVEVMSDGSNWHVTGAYEVPE
tara:strand:+ start:17449 stop:19752 length:2304 start_codon:yes stop_codon:yes gene_type:complete